MRNLLLICPEDLFQQIEKKVTENPSLLKAYHWHELPNGNEAHTESQILDKHTAHCLAGWIVALTERAVQFERMRDDVDDFANNILHMSGRKPIPFAIYHSDEESMLKIIKMRAAEERIAKASGLNVEKYNVN